ncbi:ribonuclease HI [Carnobacterium divergens]|uniref:ribonuclease HI family protein n=1 Tax=Carnobacterium divergens TaxID=2748 RepID=UPI000D4A383D|nr:ribonuclease HI family protein [Carnobacterium divergens]MCO6017746.1 ribonuclease HI family protein [Carnobacterium divergens]TFI60836.1 ribonuclease HI [Carnobacterium divergens]TFI87859.1 ribonuclease HI [Carnobacterium divergens]TFJ02427.1 ribonuclease HI [Carnobacterium divergens]TFJ03937.1 ribonuclease HI [Carnobacterium divergens]
MLKIYTDAATKGNPGPSGVGIVISGPKQFYQQLAIPLQENCSNHEAEFQALLIALQHIEKQHLLTETVMIYTDSKIVANSVERNYAKNDQFATYLKPIHHILNQIELSFINWIPEAQNKGADHLARQALQLKLKEKA